jgi:crotonobetainyl-CoA:carnitine CoA-transferase CaiB-like acyl-CoA transferase
MHVLASPIRIDGQRMPSSAAPLLGQDSDAILGELGYDAGAIADMRRAGVI